MADHVQPGRTGDEQEVSSSGLVLSVDPLAGTTGYKLSTDDTDAGSDKSDDSTDTIGGDTGGDANDKTDLAGGDTDGSDASDTDTLGGDSDESDTSDADGTDLGDSEDETESGLGGVNPLGINRPERVKNDDDKDTSDT